MFLALSEEGLWPSAPVSPTRLAASLGRAILQHGRRPAGILIGAELAWADHGDAIIPEVAYIKHFRDSSDKVV